MHVAITGASSGIGEALAREYARAGARVTLVARRVELLDKLAATLPTESFVAAADLADPPRATEWIATAEAKLGPIDVLVNNAGMQIVARREAVTVEQGERTLRLNLLTPIRLMDAVIPAMLARGRGAIVNVASMAAKNSLPDMAHYNASKAGFAHYSESMRGELRGSGVTVLTVYPGPVHTPMGDGGLVSYGNAAAARSMPFGRADVLAYRIRRGVERGSARIVYPRFYYLSYWMPGVARFFTDRFAPRAVAAPGPRS